MKKFDHPKSLNIIVLCLIAFIFSCQTPNPATPHSDLPNIVLILADDIGLGDIGFYHRQRTGEAPYVETPNIDELIQEGMRFDDAHTSASLCSPSRFGILTGNYSLRTRKPSGTWFSWKKSDIDTSIYATLGTVAQHAGYRTAFFGKFGVGGQFEPEKNFKNRVFGPNQIGFDYAFELPSGIQGSPLAYYENNQWMPLRENSQIVQLKKKQTLIKIIKKSGSPIEGDSNWNPYSAGKILSRKFNTFLDSYYQSYSRPFFVYYASQAIHSPFAPADSIGNNVFNAKLGVRKLDMIKELDLQVGNIIEQLKVKGVYDNTLIIFTSDNGGLKGEMYKKHDSTNSYRGKKGSVYEGGHRVPLIFKWTHKIQPFSKSENLVSTLDLLPTIGELVDSPMQNPLDGKSLLSELLGQKQINTTPYLLHFEYRNKGDLVAIRKGDWKYIFKYTDLTKIELQEIYNLRENPFEFPDENYLTLGITPEIEKMSDEAKKIWTKEAKKKTK